MEMKNHNRFSWSPVSIAALLAFLVLTVGIGVRAGSWLAREPSVNAGDVTLGPEQQKPVPIAREIVVIRPWGFEPSSLRRPAGRFVLDVRNASGLRHVSLKLDNAVGPRVKETQMRREKPDWRSVLDLPPGVYFLTEGGHPKWRYRLEITDPGEGLQKKGPGEEH